MDRREDTGGFAGPAAVPSPDDPQQAVAPSYSNGSYGLRTRAVVCFLLFCHCPIPGSLPLPVAPSITSQAPNLVEALVPFNLGVHTHTRAKERWLLVSGST